MGSRTPSNMAGDHGMDPVGAVNLCGQTPMPLGQRRAPASTGRLGVQPGLHARPSRRQFLGARAQWPKPQRRLDRRASAHVPRVRLEAAGPQRRRIGYALCTESSLELRRPRDREGAGAWLNSPPPSPCPRLPRGRGEPVRPDADHPGERRPAPAGGFINPYAVPVGRVHAKLAQIEAERHLPLPPGLGGGGAGRGSAERLGTGFSLEDAR